MRNGCFIDSNFDYSMCEIDTVNMMETELCTDMWGKEKKDMWDEV